MVIARRLDRHAYTRSLTMPLFNFDQDSIAPTFLGWTPGLSSLASGRSMPCGCLTGTYYTWRREVVIILDARASQCPNARHRRNLVLWRGPAAPAMRPLEEASSYADPA